MTTKSKVAVRENPWMTNQIAGTNGKHYIDQIDRVTHYPEYDLPLPDAKGDQLFIEIGSGWGRWLASANRKGYIPIGIDHKIDHAWSVNQTMQDHGMNAYTVITDLSALPFKDGVIDVIWSFSAIQHAHKSKVISCLHHANRMLTNEGLLKMEFPNRDGLRNKRGPVQSQQHLWDDINDQCVRYYTYDEYKEMFTGIFGNFKATIHSLFGIGVLPEDLKYVSWKNKPLVLASLISTAIAKAIPPAKKVADSLYIEVKRKEPTEKNAVVEKFIAAHKQGFNNLNLLPLMQCPYTGGELILTPDKKYLISEKAGLKYPIMGDVPAFIPRYHEKL